MGLPAKKNERELTPLQKSFLSYLFSPSAKGDVRTAMDLAGYAKTTAPSEVISALSEEITVLSQMTLAAESGQAVYALLESLRDPNAVGTVNRIKAAKEILDRAGVQKKTDDLTLKVPSGGIVILPAKVSVPDFIELELELDKEDYIDITPDTLKD